MSGSFVKKVTVIGPESTGKTELSKFLASYFNTCWVQEYAREYIHNLDVPYQESDLINIARGQVGAEDRLIPVANCVLICDTNLTVIKIWSEVKYSRCHEEILQMINARHYDLYLLTAPDILWQNDPQREHPYQREELWAMYKDEMGRQGVSYIEIMGTRAQRRKTAIKAISNLINEPKK